MLNDFNNPPIVFKIADAAKALKLAVSNALETSVQLTFEESVVVHLLDNKQEFILNDIARVLEKDKSGILRIIDRLEVKGMVRREFSGDDRRKKKIELTANGKKALKKGTKIFDGKTAAIFSGITDTEMVTFFKVLAQVTEKSKL